MDIKEYRKLEKEIDDKYKKDIHLLRTQYVNENALFKLGDYVGNITGMILVDKIGYDLLFDKLEIIYSGYRYKKIKGVITRTLDKNICELRENHNLRCIEK